MKIVIFTVLIVAFVNKSLQSPITTDAQNEVKNVDISMDFSCALNSSCVEKVTNKIVRALKTRSSVNFEIFEIKPVKNAKQSEGRSMSKIWDFVNGNSIRVPFGSYSLNLQKSTEHENSLEFFVGKAVEGKRKKFHTHHSLK